MSEDEQDTKIKELEGKMSTLETCLNEPTNGLIAKINTLMGKQDSVMTIIKYVVIPLIIILGGLIGVKIAMPAV